ncbi:MAG TPA: hypothetical protein VHF27_14110 [Acidimicrobiales bacterium]|nr:hypothetical protein [Acidimicrobiales bacterium]
MIPAVGFLPAGDERVTGTTDAVPLPHRGDPLGLRLSGREGANLTEVAGPAERRKAA